MLKQSFLLTLQPFLIEVFVMKCHYLLLILFIVCSRQLALAQDPDPLPAMAGTDQPVDCFIPEVDSCQIGYTFDDENILNFCGQMIDLSTHERKRKLRRELSSLSHLSSSLVQRANFYFPVVEPILNEYNIPDDFKYLMVVESGMNPYACSEKGAAGLWQFMAGTADNYGLTVNGEVDERFHIEKATKAACRYLRDAYKKFKDWVMVAQSYNIGQDRIRTEVARQHVSDPLELNLVEETNRYIYRIFAAKIIFTHPKNFGIDENLLYYKKIRRYSPWRH